MRQGSLKFAEVLKGRCGSLTVSEILQVSLRFSLKSFECLWVYPGVSKFLVFKSLLRFSKVRTGSQDSRRSAKVL